MSTADLVYGWTEIENALPEYEKAQAYFEGRIEEVFASPRIRRLISATGDCYRFNLVKTPVTVLANRVELIGVNATGNTAASTVIKEVWDANDMDVHYPDLFLRAFEYGDSYLMAWPIYEDDPETDSDDQLVACGVELTVHDPKNCRVIYDTENERKKAFAIKRWQIRTTLGKVWRTDLYYNDSIERYVSALGDVTGPDSWNMFHEEDELPENWLLDNPFGEIPFFHHRNALPYGRPEHKDGYGCQDAINKALITQLTTMDSHGFPQRYALTEKGAELDNNNDTPEWPSDELADDTTGVSEVIKSPSSGLRGGPGTMLELQGMQEVGQFDAADPAVFTDPAQFYIRLMAQITETPLHAFDPSGDTPSGESLKVADAPLVKKAVNRETMLKSPIRETWHFVLRVRGFDVTDIGVNFAPAQVANSKDDWEVIGLKQGAGVPKDKTLIEAGYPSEEVAAWDLTTPVLPPFPGLSYMPVTAPVPAP